jgi:predicted TIM-barrel enzyme
MVHGDFPIADALYLPVFLFNCEDPFSVQDLPVLLFNGEDPLTGVQDLAVLLFNGDDPVTGVQDLPDLLFDGSMRSDLEEGASAQW